jgi:hypothetical protein
MITAVSLVDYAIAAAGQVRVAVLAFVASHAGEAFPQSIATRDFPRASRHLPSDANLNACST